MVVGFGVFIGAICYEEELCAGDLNAQVLSDIGLCPIDPLFCVHPVDLLPDRPDRAANRGLSLSARLGWAASRGVDFGLSR